MFRWIAIIPSCVAVVVKGWIVPSMSTFTRRTPVLNTQLFDDEECFDLCPAAMGNHQDSAINGTAAQQPQRELLGTITSDQLFDDEQCLDLCNLEDPTNQQGGAQVEELPNVERKMQTPQEREIKVERDRIRLEMAYELFETKDDCDLDDISTCASRCDDCMGVGTKPCRFCLGTKSISLVGATSDMPCPVCDQKGVEICSKCRGSGQVASWTDLAKFNPEKV
jgi:DnaJ-class molecular chaperone